MRVIAVIDQRAVIEKVLRHLGLWNGGLMLAPARAPPDAKAILPEPHSVQKAIPYQFDIPPKTVELPRRGPRFTANGEHLQRGWTPSQTPVLLHPCHDPNEFLPSPICPKRTMHRRFQLFGSVQLRRFPSRRMERGIHAAGVWAARWARDRLKFFHWACCCGLKPALLLNRPLSPDIVALIALGLVVLAAATGARASEPASGAAKELNWAKEREFWSFRAPESQPQPAVKNRRWPRQRLDNFILARLEEKQLEPSAEADKRTLIRRVTFDLTGLPPTPEEVETFLKDRSSQAYEQLVERLLTSPRFGERMASLWLPLARFAEDQAHQVGNDTKFFYPNAHKYREWVIEAFNRDLPYDQFIKLQLAADKLESTNSANLAALGFLGLGPKYYDRGKVAVMADEWEDRVDTVTRTFLGLTVSCSRCHDHKFEPITVEDYYALAGVFASTAMVNRRPDGEPEDGKNEAAKMNTNTLHIVADGKVQDLNVFIRGNADRKGPVAERRFLRVLSEDQPAPFKDGSGRRELAEAIATSRNPLTARVMVNRVWGNFFGTPLVPSESNFGHSGERPRNPALLDDLAVRFLQQGWSVKSLTREMVLSATYRQSAAPDADKTLADASNELLWRMNRRRATVEQWRDAVLYVSGKLDFGGGRSLELDDPTNHHRTVHARISRLKLNDLLMLFDYPDANVHAEKRAVSNTATQKLFMLNSPFMLAQSQALAARLNADSKQSESLRIRQAYRLLFAREPEKSETELALAFLRKPAESGMTRWEQYAQLLLISNEMLYVD